jgi:hypothetical protein
MLKLMYSDKEASVGSVLSIYLILCRQAFTSIGALLGTLEGGSSTGDFERWMKGTLGMERLSPKRLSAQGLWGGLLYWEP